MRSGFVYRVFVLFASMTLSGSAMAQCVAPGCLDTTFGPNGTGEVVTVLNAFSASYKVAIEPITNPDLTITDKIVVAADDYTSNPPFMSVVRYNLDGTLDTTFGNGGVVVTNVQGYAKAIAVQSDGKIVIGGLPSVVLIRLNVDGSLDSTFGSGGVVNLTGTKTSSPQAFAIAIQSDGKIVAAGNLGSDMSAWRFNSNGALDTSFGSKGSVSVNFGRNVNSRALAVTLENVPVGSGTEQRILLGGFSSFTGAIANDNFALARITAAGQLDTSFGSGGKITKDFFNNTDVIEDLLVDAQNRILVGGQVQNSSTRFFALVRYNTNGGVDNSFGSAGTVLTQVNGASSYLNGIALQSDGSIVAAGWITGTSDSFALARFTASGALDTTFGSNGFVTDNFASSGASEADAWGVTLQPDGKIVVAGAETVSGRTENIALARFYE